MVLSMTKPQRLTRRFLEWFFIVSISAFVGHLSGDIIRGREVFTVYYPLLVGLSCAFTLGLAVISVISNDPSGSPHIPAIWLLIFFSTSLLNWLHGSRYLLVLPALCGLSWGFVATTLRYGGQ